MNKYELLYILSADADDAARETAIEKFSGIITKGGGEIENVDKWGVKRLAYPINYKADGFYVLVTFLAPPGIPAELERLMRISDEIMRFLIVRKDS